MQCYLDCGVRAGLDRETVACQDSQKVIMLSDATSINTYKLFWPSCYYRWVQNRVKRGTDPQRWPTGTSWLQTWGHPPGQWRWWWRRRRGTATAGSRSRVGGLRVPRGAGGTRDGGQRNKPSRILTTVPDKHMISYAFYTRWILPSFPVL